MGAKIWHVVEEGVEGGFEGDGAGEASKLVAVCIEPKVAVATNASASVDSVEVAAEELFLKVEVVVVEVADDDTELVQVA